jgi:hypothetical protein
MEPLKCTLNQVNCNIALSWTTLPIGAVHTYHSTKTLRPFLLCLINVTCRVSFVVFDLKHPVISGGGKATQNSYAVFPNFVREAKFTDDTIGNGVERKKTMTGMSHFLPKDEDGGTGSCPQMCYCAFASDLA